MPVVEPTPLTVQFVRHLRERGFKSHRLASPVLADEEFDVQYLDLTTLKIRAGIFTPFLTLRRVSNRTDLTRDQYMSLIDRSAAFFEHQIDSNFVVLLADGESNEQDDELKVHAAAANVAVLDRRAMDAIMDAHKGRAKERALGTALAESLGRLKLSPYVIGKHATGSRFFGRRTHIHKLLPGRWGGGCTIVGNRRIGKTSLLKEVQRRMMAEDQNLLVADIDGGSEFRNTYEVLAAIMKGLQPEAPLLRDREPDLIRKFPSLIRQLAAEKSIAVFIDELDGLLIFDAEHNYELLDTLREAFGHDRCHIFFAGFRITMEAKANKKCPLHNFGPLVALGPLTREETVEMITKPSANLGIAISQSDLIRAIYRETAGHPELVQYCGSELIQYYEEKGQLPDATTLLTRVFEDKGFEQAVFGPFLQNSTARERLACYLLIANADSRNVNLESYEFGMATIDGLLQEQNVVMNEHDLHTLVSNLRVGGITTPVEGKQHEYRFNVPQFARYCSSIDLTFLTRKALQDARISRREGSARHVLPYRS